MKQPKKIAQGAHFTAIDIGPFDQVKTYSLIHAVSGKEVPGKLFLKEPTDATGTEISVTSLPPRSGPGSFHTHTRDEETYIILSGSGYYQVDDDCFEIRPGSIVRVAPAGARSLYNISDEEMVYICIQSGENSLGKHTYDDGQRVNVTPKWE